MTETVKFYVDNLSRKTLGIKSTEAEYNGAWFNYGGLDREGTDMILSVLKKGSFVELEINEGKYTKILRVEPPEANAPAHSTPVEKKGGFLDDYVTFPELLEQLSRETDGKFCIETKLIHHDAQNKVAVVHAQVKGEFGTVARNKLVGDKVVVVEEPNARWATGHGDCDNENGGMVKIHYVRMAETRAIARALRNILGVGKTAQEELV